jgi:chromosome segregation protein
MAEVSLTLGDMDQDHLRAAGVEVAYNEATITRRIFRDGNSEYFINRTGCRLKDIQQLFMGTGVGRTSYSILAQGHITQILSSKPEDRRMIFEEAAGITKYKSQKTRIAPQTGIHRPESFAHRRSHPRSEAADRVAPAPGRQGAPLQTNFPGTPAPRHPARAPSIRRVAAEITEKQATAERLRDEIATGSAELLRCEDEIKQLRERLSELEHEVAAQQQRSLELKGEADRHESRIQFNEERLRELASQNTKALADITQAEERCHAASAELQAVTERLAASEARSCNIAWRWSRNSGR